MRQVLDAKHLKNVRVEEGISNKIPVEDQSVDAVIVAQVSSAMPNEILRELLEF